MSAAAAVADLLDRSGMSKSDLCRAAGVSRALFDDYLKGRRQPGVAQLERLGKAAGLRLDISWSAEVELDIKPLPSWINADNPEMADLPTTAEERAQLLERVVPIAMELRRRERGELEFPPPRTWRQR